MKYVDAPTKTVLVDGVPFAYRDVGDPSGIPLVLLHHLTAVLDNWDPRVVDGISAQRRVIAFDNRGVGTSGGKTPDTIEQMAIDAVAFVRALGLSQVDVLGLSMGGFIAQVMAEREPDLIRKIVLAGTGPAGGEGIDKTVRITIYDILRGTMTRRDPKEFLFFTRTSNGKREASAFLQRLKERTTDRDKEISIRAFRAQLKAVHRWGTMPAADLSLIRQPVLVANGESDRMIPSKNSVDLAERLPNGELIPLYRDAGHVGIFQNHQEFVASTLEFLGR